MKKLLITLTILAGFSSQAALAGAREEARLIEASGVLEELFAQKDTAIPEKLMSRAYGIAVIPNVVKVAAVVGGRRGSGAMVVRDANGKFSDPIMVSLTGGNVGWQIGVQSTDIVLVFTTARGVQGITDGKLTLGADASVAAGPVGRAASAATDQNFTAEVYSYSRNRGLFAGVSLDGSILAIDSKGNKGLYGKSTSADDIISGALVENIVIYDNSRAGGSGINADGVQNSVFRNNLIYGNHASGMSLYRIDGGGGSSGNLVANNTIVGAADSRWALNINSGSTGNTVVNNILYTYHSFRGSITMRLMCLDSRSPMLRHVRPPSVVL